MMNRAHLDICIRLPFLSALRVSVIYATPSLARQNKMVMGKIASMQAGTRNVERAIIAGNW